jgi:hypothetical protein
MEEFGLLESLELLENFVENGSKICIMREQAPSQMYDSVSLVSKDEKGVPIVGFF